MTFTYDQPPPAVLDRPYEHRDNLAPAMHIEQTPCMTMPAITISPAITVKLWAARIARAWMASP